MAVNGVEIEVGQVWVVSSRAGSHQYRIAARARSSADGWGWYAEKLGDLTHTRTWFSDSGVADTMLGHNLHSLAAVNRDFPPLDLPATQQPDDANAISKFFNTQPVSFVPKRHDDKLARAPAIMDKPGYETLAVVLHRAYIQAAVGKGVERHAVAGEPFDKQVMQIGAQKFGHGSLLFQAFKKSEESQRLPHDRAVNELLGAIVYLAGAVVALEAAKGAK